MKYFIKGFKITPGGNLHFRTAHNYDDGSPLKTLTSEILLMPLSRMKIATSATRSYYYYFTAKNEGLSDKTLKVLADNGIITVIDLLEYVIASDNTPTCINSKYAKWIKVLATAVHTAVPHLINVSSDPYIMVTLYKGEVIATIPHTLAQSLACLNKDEECAVKGAIEELICTAAPEIINNAALLATQRRIEAAKAEAESLEKQRLELLSEVATLKAKV